MFSSRAKLISGLFLAAVIISSGYILYTFLHSSDNQLGHTSPVPIDGAADGKSRNSLEEPGVSTWSGSARTSGGNSRERQSGGLLDARARRSPGERSEAQPASREPASRGPDESSFDSFHFPRGITEDDIPPEYGDRLDDFLDRIEEVGEEGLSESEKERMDQVFFTTARPDIASGPVFFTELFSPHSNRIYGAFYSVTDNLAGRDRVLVKWTGARGDLLLYEYMAITPSSTFNYVWWDEGFWDTGIYSLTLYGLEDDIEPLAYGSYRVDTMSEFIGHLDLYEELDQGVTQSDFAFSSRIILSFTYAVPMDTLAALAVYKIETGEYIIDEDVELPAADSDTFTYVLKEPNDSTFPFGTFKVEIWTDREFPVGQNQFIHHE